MYRFPILLLDYLIHILFLSLQMPLLLSESLISCTDLDRQGFP